MENTTQNPSSGDDGKTIAIVSYLTIIGWIIAYVMHGSNKTSAGAYHLRQTLLLHIIALCLWILNMLFVFIPFLGWLINIVIMLAGIGLFVLWLLGLIAAINGEEKPMPLIGVQAHKMFSGIK